jgi:CubicO group peptidase (beta-lactamase class C family)
MPGRRLSVPAVSFLTACFVTAIGASVLVAAAVASSDGRPPQTAPVSAGRVDDVPASSRAEPQPSAEIAAALEPIIAQHKIPGMVAAIVESGPPGTLAIGCAGVRRNVAPEKITIADRMHIGSCTKSMTATMIATLVQDEELKWDTTVSEAFGDLDGKMNAAWRDVTLAQLLTNRSGAPGDLSKHALWRELWAHSGPATSARMLLVEGVLSQPPEAAPGEKYIYSNAGFSIAGAMAEKVTGESWEDLMMVRLFEPLEMNSAGFGAPGSAKSIDQPRGHGSDGTPREPGPGSDNPAAIGPAGVVHCNLIDWSKYIALHLRGGQSKDTAILKRDAFKALHAPVKKADGDGGAPDYAMGWGVTRRPWAGDGAGGGKALTHNGSNTMWFAVTWLAPQRDFAVLIACNMGGKEAEKACDEAAAAMIKMRQGEMRWP